MKIIGLLFTSFFFIITKPFDGGFGQQRAHLSIVGSRSLHYNIPSAKGKRKDFHFANG